MKIRETAKRLPARFWKWRRQGAALYFAKNITSLANYHGLITTDLISLSDFKALSKDQLSSARPSRKNIGISVVEAIRYGSIPLLLARLAYPEIIPTKYHPDVLYRDHQDLVATLLKQNMNFAEYRNLRQVLSNVMGRFARENSVELYDQELENLAQIRG